MKKIILLLTLILCIAVGSKELSKLEKKEALNSPEALFSRRRDGGTQAVRVRPEMMF